MTNNSIPEDEFDEKFIHDLEKMIKSQRNSGAMKTPELIHGERLLTVMDINNISTLGNFAFEIESTEKNHPLSTKRKKLSSTEKCYEN